MRPLADYLDANGYPGTIQADGSYDGGDTAAIIGTVKALTPAAAGLTMPTIPCNLALWVPIRHSDKTRWYGQPDRFSRDQLLATLCGLLARYPGDYKALCDHTIMTNAMLNKSYLTAWNTKGNGAMDMPDKFPDICGPEVWALWLRILKPWWGRLFLCTFDVQTLIGAIQWRWFTPATNRVTRNHMLVCLATIEHQPTLVSRLACLINNWTDLVDRWDNHCKAVGEYPTADLFRDKIRSIVK